MSSRRLQSYALENTAFRNFLEKQIAKADVQDLTVESFGHLIKCSRQEVIQLFKDFENSGCGEFIVGRRGQPSRFSWTKNIAMLEQPIRDILDANGASETGANLSSSNRAAGEISAGAPMSIAEAKKGLAATFNVHPENIEIIIRS